ILCIWNTAQLVRPSARCREPFPGIARYNAAQYHFIAILSISSGSKRSRVELPAWGAIITLPVDEGEGPRLTPNTMLVDAVHSYFRQGGHGATAGSGSPAIVHRRYAACDKRRK